MMGKLVIHQKSQLRLFSSCYATYTTREKQRNCFSFSQTAETVSFWREKVLFLLGEYEIPKGRSFLLEENDKTAIFWSEKVPVS